MKLTEIEVRHTEERDFAQIIQMCREVYPGSASWSEEQLASHLAVFPEGQLVALQRRDQRVVGMASSLIVSWDDYDAFDSWRDFTDQGMFTNHDAVNGKTLYGAEVMVRPDCQGKGVGSALYCARRNLVTSFGLSRIRAGSRLRGYQRYAETIDAPCYVQKVVEGEIGDPTLSFQLRHGFRVLAVVPGYLKNDPESLGWAALIEWLNPGLVLNLEPDRKQDRHFPDAPVAA
jgi:GNAT superfamily N-acetyltransferase